MRRLANAAFNRIIVTGISKRRAGAPTAEIATICRYRTARVSRYRRSCLKLGMVEHRWSEGAISSPTR